MTSTKQFDLTPALEAAIKQVRATVRHMQDGEAVERDYGTAVTRIICINAPHDGSVVTWKCNPGPRDWDAPATSGYAISHGYMADGLGYSMGNLPVEVYLWPDADQEDAAKALLTIPAN